MMNRRTLNKSLGAVAGALLAGGAMVLPTSVLAADLGPQAMVEKVAGDILSAIKADKSVQGGDVNRIMALVDSRVMPHVNFERMMGTAVGPAWRQATSAQKKQVQDEFKKLLVRTYAGAFKMAGNRSLKVLPVRAASCWAAPARPRSTIAWRRLPTAHSAGVSTTSPLKASGRSTPTSSNLLPSCAPGGLTA